MRSACVCWLCRLLAADFAQEKISATHPCTFGCRFRLAEPGRIAIGCCYCLRLKPCLGRFCGCFYHSRTLDLLAIHLFLERQSFWFGFWFRGKTQPQPFCTDAYFDKKTLSTTPRPLYRWKAEIISFLRVLLVWGVKLTSLLNKMCQSWGYVLKYAFWWNRQKER